MDQLEIPELNENFTSALPDYLLLSDGKAADGGVRLTPVSPSAGTIERLKDTRFRSADGTPLLQVDLSYIYERIQKPEDIALYVHLPTQFWKDRIIITNPDTVFGQTGLTAPVIAAARGDSDMTRKYLQCGSDINFRSKGGNTILMEASYRGHINVVLTALEAGADINMQNERGQTALVVSILADKSNVAETLITRGAAVNKTNRLGRTALMIAAYKGNEQIVQHLVEIAKVDITAEDNFGLTAVCIAETQNPTIAAALCFYLGKQDKLKHFLRKRMERCVLASRSPLLFGVFSRTVRLLLLFKPARRVLVADECVRLITSSHVTRTRLEGPDVTVGEKVKLKLEPWLLALACAMLYNEDTSYIQFTKDTSAVWMLDNFNDIISSADGRDFIDCLLVALLGAELGRIWLTDTALKVPDVMFYMSDAGGREQHLSNTFMNMMHRYYSCYNLKERKKQLTDAVRHALVPDPPRKVVEILVTAVQFYKDLVRVASAKRAEYETRMRDSTKPTGKKERRKRDRRNKNNNKQGKADSNTQNMAVTENESKSNQKETTIEDIINKCMSQGDGENTYVDTPRREHSEIKAAEENYEEEEGLKNHNKNTPRRIRKAMEHGSVKAKEDCYKGGDQIVKAEDRQKTSFLPDVVTPGVVKNHNKQKLFGSQWHVQNDESQEEPPMIQADDKKKIDNVATENYVQQSENKLPSKSIWPVISTSQTSSDSSVSVRPQHAGASDNVDDGDYSKRSSMPSTECRPHRLPAMAHPAPKPVSSAGSFQYPHGFSPFLPAMPSIPKAALDCGSVEAMLMKPKDTPESKNVKQDKGKDCTTANLKGMPKSARAPPGFKPLDQNNNNTIQSKDNNPDTTKIPVAKVAPVLHEQRNTGSDRSDNNDKTIIPVVYMPSIHAPEGESHILALCWKKKSTRWRDYLQDMVDLPVGKRKTIDKIYLCDKEEKFAIKKGRLGTKVFVGLHEDGTELAVKKMMKAYYLHPERLSKLKAISKLSSRYVVPIKGYWSDIYFGYIATELQEFNLDEYLKSIQLGEFTPQCKKQLIQQLLEALAELERHRIPHLFLKPSNILLLAGGRLRLSDVAGGIVVLGHEASEGLCWRSKEALTQGEENLMTRPYSWAWDAQVAGMLINYIFTEGRHPYGTDYSSCKENIASDRVVWAETRDMDIFSLLRGLLQPNPDLRMSATSALRHPYLWNEKAKIQFLIAVGKMHEFQHSVNNAVMIKLNNALQWMGCQNWLMQYCMDFPKREPCHDKYTSSVIDLIKCVADTNDMTDTNRPTASWVLSTYPRLFTPLYDILRDAGWFARTEILNVLNQIQQINLNFIE